MSKMRMPEMSVVRFEENDVICASTLTLMSLHQFDNHHPNDAYVTAGGVDYHHTSSTNFDDLMTKYTNVDYSTMFFWDDGDEGFGQASFRGLVEYDEGTSASGNYTDGFYNYLTDGSCGVGFYHTGCQ